MWLPDILASALMTFPRDNRPRLMRSPSAFVFFCLSEPARSTKLLTNERGEKATDLSPWLRCSSVMVKMAWERDDAAFMAVEPTVRAEFPCSRQQTISWELKTSESWSPSAGRSAG
uniref:Uncharacterized protein n=1 Tax=Denticeps clupeoides TaxID=299321 RepID=A0A8C4A4M2_9TELE